MKRIHAFFSPHRQRMSWIILSMLLQLGLFLVVFLCFNQYFVFFYWLGVLVSVGVSLYISTRKTRLAYKIAWIIPILLVPLMGGIMYLVLGGGKKQSYQQAEARRTYRKYLFPAPEAQTLLAPYGPDAVQQGQYLQKAALCPAYPNTETQYFPSGEAFLPVFLAELEQARHYIFLEYFIIAEGSLWSEVVAVLRRKAAEGVDVRVIYDGIGSASTLPDDYQDELAEMGIACRPFRPLLPVLSVHQNNRDHRKLTVIDGVTGFVGGLNLADEYVARKERFGYWKDNALLLRGEAVWSLTVFFLTMWDDCHSPRTDCALFRPKALPPLSAERAAGIVLPYTDTPMPGDTVYADLFLQMTMKAKDYLYLTTPYLVLDESLASALCTAALSGVDVRLITPHIPDKKVVFAVTRSHYEALLEAGVRIYEFTPGFLHTKTAVADDQYASVGSCNLDYRSFYLQFENGVWLCGSPAVADVKADFLQTMALSQEITLTDCSHCSPLTKLLRSIYRLFSPLF